VSGSRPKGPWGSRGVPDARCTGRVAGTGVDVSYGHTAINTGYYTFSYVKDGETKTIPARYSFVYVKSDRGWLIVDHHSSAMPPPLR